MIAYYNDINWFHRHSTVLRYYHTEQDYDSYEFFLPKMYLNPMYVKHKILNHLIGCVGYVPDYKLAYKYQHGRFADLFLIEVKNIKKNCTPDTDDMVKINL